MTYEPIASDVDSLCEGRSGSEIIALVLERFPAHRDDPLQALFCCTYAKMYGGDPTLLAEPAKRRVMLDYVHYFAQGEQAQHLPDYFVRCLLPEYLGAAAS